MDTTGLIDTDHLAAVVPIRRSVRTAPARPVNRRAGSRGPRYLHGNPSADWHLSRRGELLLHRFTVAVAAAVVILVVIAAGFAFTRGLGGAPLQTREFVVQPGQSLWQVAAATSHGADVSDTTDQIRALNHLDASPLTPGQVLLVPVSR